MKTWGYLSGGMGPIEAHVSRRERAASDGTGPPAKISLHDSYPLNRGGLAEETGRIRPSGAVAICAALAKLFGQTGATWVFCAHGIE